MTNSASTLPAEISDLKNVWTDDSSAFSFLVKGIKITGELRIANESVTISGSLPLIFFPLKKQIEKIVRERATALLL